MIFLDTLYNLQVNGITIVERTDCCAALTDGIDVRVGFTAPFESGTNADTIIDFNTLCAKYDGPAAVGDRTVITCTGNFMP